MNGEDRNFVLIAHRGGLFYRPENSLAAFENSISLGIEWAECDIRLSKDGQPVVFHDDRIPFQIGATRSVRDLTAAELSKVDIGGGETVPTLDELLNQIGHRMRLDLELKELDAVSAVIDSVRQANLKERVIISSFIPEALQLSRDIEPRIDRGLLVDRLTGRIMGGRSAVRAALLLGCKYFLPHYRSLTVEWIQAVQKEGMLVVPWTVNLMTEAEALIELGVNGLISDRPDQFLPLLANR